MDGPQYGKVPLGRVRWLVFGGGCVCALLCFPESPSFLPECLLRRALMLVSVSDFPGRAAFMRDVVWHGRVKPGPRFVAESRVR